MDSKKLFKAACKGDIEALNNLLEENPLALVEFSLTSPKDSLLHLAVKAQQPKFVHELIERKPDLAYELNKDGLRPIDIASIIGNIEIVKEILSVDHKIFRLEGREKRTALHYAAIYGRIEVIDEFMTVCDEGVKDVSDYEESALHLALKNNQVDGFCVLIKWVERVKMEYVINWADCDGNTVLHIAASKKQLQGIKQLLNGPIGNIVEVNAKNSKGLTPMDLLDIMIENPNDFHLKDILAQAGSLRAQDMINIQIPPQQSLQPIDRTNRTEHAKINPDRSKNWLEYFKFQDGRDSPSHVCNTLLVVVALIVTVTYQAGIDPPSHMIRQKSPQNSTNVQLPDNNVQLPDNNDNTTRLGSPGLTPGLFVSSLSFTSGILDQGVGLYAFVFLNTLGLTASINIIQYLTSGFPFQRELLMSIYSMGGLYGFCISSIPGNDLTAAFLFMIALVLPYLLRRVPRWGRKAWKWLRRTREPSHLPIELYGKLQKWILYLY